MSSLWALAAILAAQSPSCGADDRFELLGCPARVAAKRLSDSLKTKLEVADELAAEPVFIVCDKQKLPDMVACLAKVLNAEWVDSNGKRRLTRSDKIRTELATNCISGRRSKLAQLLEALRSEVRDLNEPSRVAARAMEEFDKWRTNPNKELQAWLVSPSMLLLDQALLAVGEEALAALPLRKPVVYSDAPTNVQRKLSWQGENLRKLYQESEEFLRNVEMSAGLYGSEQETFLRLFRAKGAGEPVGKILLFLWRDRDRIAVSIAIYGRDGQIRSENSRYLGMLQSATGGLEMPSDAHAPLSDLSAKFARIVQSNGQSGDSSKQEDALELLKLSRTEESFEPLSMVVGDAMYGISTSKGCSVVARLPDWALDDVLSTTRSNRSKLKELMQKLAISSFEEFDVASNTFLMYPRDTLDCETLRLPRIALKDFVSSSDKERQAGLRRFCRLYFAAGDSMKASRIVHGWLAVLKLSGVTGTDSPQLGGGFCRLLGSFNDTQWMLLERGDRIAGFAPWQSSLVRLIADPGATTATRPPGSKTLVPDILLTGTECMPGTVPPETFVQLTSQSELFAQNATFFQGSGFQALFNRPMTAERVAETLHFNHGDIALLTSLAQDKLLFGSRSKQVIVLGLVDGVEIVREIPGKGKGFEPGSGDGETAKKEFIEAVRNRRPPPSPDR